MVGLALFTGFFHTQDSNQSSCSRETTCNTR